jgi:hypothetical protein
MLCIPVKLYRKDNISTLPSKLKVCFRNPEDLREADHMKGKQVCENMLRNYDYVVVYYY